MGWLVVGYLGSLAVLLVTSFWTLGELSGEIEQTFTLDNYKDVVSESVYRSVTGRTVMIAALVTVTDIAARVPDRLLHGEGREADDARCARGRRAGAALVRVPRQGVRLARASSRRRASSTGCSIH